MSERICITEADKQESIAEIELEDAVGKIIDRMRILAGQIRKLERVSLA